MCVCDVIARPPSTWAAVRNTAASKGHAVASYTTRAPHTKISHSHLHSLTHYHTYTRPCLLRKLPQPVRLCPLLAWCLSPRASLCPTQKRADPHAAARAAAADEVRGIVCVRERASERESINFCACVCVLVCVFVSVWVFVRVLAGQMRAQLCFSTKCARRHTNTHTRTHAHRCFSITCSSSQVPAPTSTHHLLNLSMSPVKYIWPRLLKYG